MKDLTDAVADLLEDASIDPVDLGYGGYGMTGEDARRIAPAILAAITEARTICTVEDLEALPVGAVVKDSNTCVVRNGMTLQLFGTGWYEPGDYVERSPILPALVLWLPEGVE